MNKQWFVLPVVVSLSGCSMVNSGSQAEGQAPQMMHHSDDTKGTSTFPKQRQATGNKTLIFDPKATAWAAYDASGNRLKTGRASGGKAFCPDIGRGCKTTTGTYRVFSKKGADCKSSKYPIKTGGGAPMPYCMHFNGGYALHGSYNVPDHNASHGCIRLLPSAAKWLSENFVEIGTTVIVKPY